MDSRQTKLTFLSRAFLSLLALSAFGFSRGVAAQPNTVQSLIEGPPAAIAQLNAAAFTTYESQKLAKPTVWYIDYEYLRKHGVNVPANGLNSPEFAKEVTDAFGWQSRSRWDHDDEFLSEKKLRYTDYYGGYGMGSQEAGGNYGSGRAGINGSLQSKGELTPLAQSKDPFHSNGAVQTIEAIDEAIWSNVLNSELKMGANRVVGIILTGTFAEMKSGQVFPRALIIREMAIRPAHFMINHFLPAADEIARIKKLMPQLLNSLPYPDAKRPSDDRTALRVGIEHLIDLEASAQAEYFAKRMFFGSVTPSNLEITGRRLDLGDHTAVEGFTKIYRLNWQDDSPFGETNEFIRMFESLISSLEQTLPAELKTALPSAQEVRARFLASFALSQKREMALLTGVPTEIATSLQNHESLLALGSLLTRIARDGNVETVFMDPKGWANKGTYNLGAILTNLVHAPKRSVESYERALADLMTTDPQLRTRLAEAYFNFQNAAVAEAAKQGVHEGALLTYMQQAVKLRNADRSSLVRGDRRWKEMWNISDQAIHDGNRAAVETYIEQQSSKNIFNFKDAGAYQLVLHEEKNALDGVSKRRVYDAKNDVYSTVVRVSMAGGKGRLNGKTIQDSDGEHSAIELHLKSGRSLVARAQRTGESITYTFKGRPDADLNAMQMLDKKALFEKNVPVRNVSVKNVRTGVRALRCEMSAQ